MNPVVKTHRSAGSFFEAGGVRSFRLDEGDGEPVVLMHGVPASCFLYRKVVPALAQRGLRGIAFDLPGLGLADRPEEFDYSWTGLGRFATAAVRELGIDRFHVVVHDIGGPVGFELAAQIPERVASLTILNTMIEVDRFKKPWSMRPFEVAGLDRMWLAPMKFRPMFRMLMSMQGVEDRSKVPNEELDAYVDLLFGQDEARAFLKMMKAFETTSEKSALYQSVVSSNRYPKQVVWGENDPALTYSVYGKTAERLTSTNARRLPGKHFLQEDQYDAIAESIQRIAG